MIRIGGQELRLQLFKRHTWRERDDAPIDRWLELDFLLPMIYFNHTPAFSFQFRAFEVSVYSNEWLRPMTAEERFNNAANEMEKAVKEMRHWK